jgi:hypothetical protein
MVWLRLPERHLAIGADRLRERLPGIEEALVGDANGAAPRGSTERRPEQEELVMALGLETLAQQ